MNTQHYLQQLTSLEIEQNTDKNAQSVAEVKNKINRGIKKRKSAGRAFFLN
jgi:hypothetical protein